MMTLGAVLWLCAAAAPSPPAEDGAAGDRLYRELCLVCHGSAGQAEGAVARHLRPRPRDFTRGEFKFRSTPSGEPPTARDVFRIITEGARGTAMPSFSGLSSDERWQLTYRVLALAGVPVTAGAPLPPGERLYGELGCGSCHGEDGRGRGASAAALKDARGLQVYPANLRRAESYRAGCSEEAIARTLQTGLDGSAMPAYALAEEDLRALAHYVRGLIAAPYACR